MPHSRILPHEVVDTNEGYRPMMSMPDEQECLSTSQSLSRNPASAWQMLIGLLLTAGIVAVFLMTVFLGMHY